MRYILTGKKYEKIALGQLYNGDQYLIDYSMNFFHFLNSCMFHGYTACIIQDDEIILSNLQYMQDFNNMGLQIMIYNFNLERFDYYTESVYSSLIT